MIPIGIPQRLGKSTLVIYMLRAIAPTIVLLCIVAILAFSRDVVLKYLVSLGTEAPISIANAQHIFQTFVPALFFISIILGCAGLMLNALRYHFFTFEIDEFELRLKTGIFNLVEISIPYRQIQDVDITRSFVYRIFRLSRLAIISAGHSDPGEPDKTNTIFDPMDADIAEEIKEILSRRIGVQITKTERQADEKEKIEEAMSAARL